MYKISKSFIYLVFTIHLIMPLQTFSLTSGPAMPEYIEFESVENTDLVNLPTGAFSYQVPIMTVPGPALSFPIVLSYHGGIMPEQEATWVGLGWNLQAGAITRRINNIPDDFSGEIIVEEITSKHIYGRYGNIEYGGVTVGLSWDSERGMGIMGGLSAGGGFTENSPLGMKLGITYGYNSPWDGLSISPGLTVTNKLAGDESAGLFATSGFGMNINTKSSRASVGFQHQVSFAEHNRQTNTTSSMSLMSVGVSMSHNSLSGSVGAGGYSVSKNMSVSNHIKQSDWSISVPFITPKGWGSVTYGEWELWSDGLSIDEYFGFLFADNSGMGCVSGENCSTNKRYHFTPLSGYKEYWANKMEVNNSEVWVGPAIAGYNVKIASTAEDLYSVASQGLSGSFKPYRTEDGDYYTFLSKQKFETDVDCDGPWGYLLGFDCTEIQELDVSPYLVAGRNHHAGTFSSRDNIVWKFTSDAGGALYTDINGNRDTGPVATSYSKKIKPLYKENKINAWLLTSSNGTRYLYTKTLNNITKKTVTGPDYQLSEITSQIVPSYTYAWLLTAILSPDYIEFNKGGGPDPHFCYDYDNGNLCLPHDDDLGGWVRFEYSQNDLYQWQVPYEGSSMLMRMNQKLQPTGYQMSKGLKEVSYLDRIVTPTHIAEFSKSDRQDGLGSASGTEIIMNPTSTDVVSKITTAQCQVDGEVRKLNQYHVEYQSGLPSGMVGRLEISQDILSPLTCMESSSERNLLDEAYVIPSDGIIRITNFFSREILNSAIDPAVYDGEQYNFRMYFTPILSNVHHKLKKLDMVLLKAKKFGNEVISSVKFGYDYSAASGTPNTAIGHVDNPEMGKLNLKSVRKGASETGPWMPSYDFMYSSTSYDFSKVDKWGYYCRTCTETIKEPDGSANAWELSSITLPSGCQLEIEYEPNRIHWISNIVDSYGVLPGGRHPTVWRPLPSSDPDAVITGDKYWDFNGEQSHRRIHQNVIDYLDDHYSVLLGEINYVGRRRDEDNDRHEENRFFTDLFSFANSLVGVAPSHYLIESQHMDEHHAKYEKYVQVNYDGRTPNHKINIDSDNLFYVGSVYDNTPPKNVSYTITTLVQSGQFGCQVFDSKQDPHGINCLLPHRVWALYDDLPEPSIIGGGLRVAKIIYTDRVEAKKTELRYSYGEGVVNSLPNTYSSYSTDFLQYQQKGLEPFVGQSGILYTSTSTSFAESEYLTVHKFYTPKDFPNIIDVHEPNPVMPGVDKRVQILDFSPYWGLLSERIEYKDPVNDEKTRYEVTKYAGNWKNRELSSRFGNYPPKVMFPNRFDDEVRTVSMVDQKVNRDYFGYRQQLYSHRYFERPCSYSPNLVTPTLNCIDTPKSLQIGLYTVFPFVTQTISVVDDVLSVNASMNFDFLTAAPLVSRVENHDKYMYTVNLPAYYYHSDMKGKNMLDQLMTTTNFLSPSDYQVLEVNTDDISDVKVEYLEDNGDGGLSVQGDIHISAVSSNYDLWLDFISPKSGETVKRKAASYAWNVDLDEITDLYKFKFPLPQKPENWPVPSKDWTTKGQILKYDDFSHVTEYENSEGMKNAQIFGYGEILPTAFIRNSAYSGALYESFESSTDYETGCNSTPCEDVHYELVQLNSKTGKKAILVKNQSPADWNLVCLEMHPFEMNKEYTASVWYFDDSQDAKPGIWLGAPSTTDCGTHSFPNGDGDNLPEVPGNENHAAKAKGDHIWKRMEVSMTCGSQYDKAFVCIYAGRATSSTNILYDELRVAETGGHFSSYAYDERGNVISASDLNENVKQFQYDKFSNLTSIKDDEGRILSERAKSFGRILSRNVAAKTLYLDASGGGKQPEILWGDYPIERVYEIFHSSNPSRIYFDGQNVLPVSYDPQSHFSKEVISMYVGEEKQIVKFHAVVYDPGYLGSPLASPVTISSFPLSGEIQMVVQPNSVTGLIPPLLEMFEEDVVAQMTNLKIEFRLTNMSRPYTACGVTGERGEWVDAAFGENLVPECQGNIRMYSKNYLFDYGGSGGLPVFHMGGDENNVWQVLPDNSDDDFSPEVGYIRIEHEAYDYIWGFTMEKEVIISRNNYNHWLNGFAFSIIGSNHGECNEDAEWAPLCLRGARVTEITFTPYGRNYLDESNE